MTGKQGKKTRVPQLKHTHSRGIGWHVSYRDPKTNSPTKYRFRVETREEALPLYHAWLGDFLQGTPHQSAKKLPPGKPVRAGQGSDQQKSSCIGVQVGSIAHVASGLLEYDGLRIREEGAPRTSGSITSKEYEERQRFCEHWFAFVNQMHGYGAVGRIRVDQLTMADVEEYNKALAAVPYSESQIRKRMLVINQVIERAGRPEFGGQVLSWNWNSKDRHYGKPNVERRLPKKRQLQSVLRLCGKREELMLWMAIGCGFGQSDLSAVRVEQFSKKSYDLRRGMTGIERYGETPPLVWVLLSSYVEATSRSAGELLFVTRTGKPLVHGKTDSVAQWWLRIRKRLGKDAEGLGGFYTLRHLGATEFGSREGASIGEMKKWLGHSASSAIADNYMKPVSPECEQAVEWVRAALSSQNLPNYT